MASLSYYFRVWRACARTSLIRDMEFRGNFLVNVFLGLVWIAFQLFILEVIFTHTQMLGGWSHAEVLLLLGFWLFLDKTLSVFVGQGLRRIPFDVRDGMFDFHIVKPISTQFFVSFRYFDIKDASDVVLSLAIMGYAILAGGLSPSFVGILFAMLFLFCSFLLGYILWFSLEIFSIWFINIDNIENLFRAVMRIGRFPTDIFARTIRILFLTLVPVTILTNFPVQAYLQHLSPLWMLYTLFFTAGIFFAVRVFWRHALHYYSSASS